MRGKIECMADDTKYPNAGGVGGPPTRVRRARRDITAARDAARGHLAQITASLGYAVEHAVDINKCVVGVVKMADVGAASDDPRICLGAGKLYALAVQLALATVEALRRTLEQQEGQIPAGGVTIQQTNVYQQNNSFLKNLPPDKAEDMRRWMALIGGRGLVDVEAVEPGKCDREVTGG